MPINGKKAIGIEYMKRGKLHRAFAGREVVLCAGAINSPQILLLSGVGSASLLKQIEIDVVHSADGVGQNLQDHLCCPRVATLNNQLHPWWGGGGNYGTVHATW